MIRFKFYFAMILAAFFAAGCSNDSSSVISLEGGDEEMNQAYMDARESASEFISGLAQPKPGHRYLVKMRIEADHEIEHIWTKGVSHKDGTFYGVIANEPHRITSLKMGSPSEAAIEAISDWAIIDPEDEIIAGGFTIEVMKKKRAAAENEE